MVSIIPANIYTDYQSALTALVIIKEKYSQAEIKQISILLTPPNPVLANLIKEFQRLEDQELKLIALENCGVDNWTGYDLSMNLYRTGQEK